MTSRVIKNCLLVGDSHGVNALLTRIPVDSVVGIVGASIRPDYHEKLDDLATRNGLPLLIQPHANSPDYASFVEKLRALQPDGLICHSYSMLIPVDVLNLVSGMAFNVHAALLPRNRGPNPVQWALIHGDEKTGSTVHVMDQCFDCGAIIDQEEIDILDQDTWKTLSARVNSATGRLLDRVIPTLLEGSWHAKPQDNELAVRNKRIPKESFEIDFLHMSDLEIFNLIRAQVAPLRGAYLDTPERKIRFVEPLSMAQVAKLRKDHE